MSQDKMLSGKRRLWGLAQLLLVMLASSGLGLWLSGAFDQPQDTTPQTGAVPVVGIVIISAVLAALLLIAGGVIYGIVLLTNCFTMNMSKPFMGTLGKKLWLGNLVVGLFLGAGVANVAAMFLCIPMSLILQGTALFIVSAMVPFALMQFVFAWFILMSPIIPRLVRARLKARGVAAEQLATARIIGTSDPTLTKRKFGIIEQDLGALWITADHLLFMGDQCDWTIRHSQLLAVERQAHAKSSEAYFGAVHVILRFQVDGRPEQRIRLHDEHAWTATGAARELNAIAGRLEAWLANPTAGWPEPQGFAVTMANDAPPQAG